jgi:hypothetical protein
MIKIHSRASLSRCILFTGGSVLRATDGCSDGDAKLLQEQHITRQQVPPHKYMLQKQAMQKTCMTLAAYYCYRLSYELLALLMVRLTLLILLMF